MNCCACSAECALVLPVGDLPGCRASDVVCSPECEDALVSDGHNDARYDGDTCQCGTCWRVARREAHAKIAQHRRRHV